MNTECGSHSIFEITSPVRASPTVKPFTDGKYLIRMKNGFSIEFYAISTHSIL